MAKAPPERRIAHIDMDAFFASIEQLDHPEWRGKPLAVGDGPRSVVSAASYEIRAFGVRSAMPVQQAKKLCPQGIFVPVRMWRYKELSRRVMAVLQRFSPLVEQASVDEAYLDATGLERLFGPPEEFAGALRAAVKEETGLTCSVGMAPVRFLAKIASDYNKPDGQTIIRPGDMRAFLDALPVQKVPGVGGRTLETLQKLGVKNAGDVLRQPASFWQKQLGERGLWLHALAQGRDDRPVTPFTPPKSSSAENTFDKDTRDPATLRRWLLLQSDRVGADLRAQGVRGRTVTLKAKFADFSQVTRSRTLPEAICDTQTIFDTAVSLLAELNPRQDLRLIGVGVSQFGDRPRQLSLMEPEPTARPKGALDSAMDAVRGRFGKGAIMRGELLNFDE
ncbi:MAG TPA: DNA polymerase IV [Humidesulfovibrio sp.]|uniref:DNA polymerase IV n=1 Tax=Humidesulfovibrio sp. TaxID=2910988 RepID=UPI002CFF7A28|nr:DNA polymerase IV [Humidesulfovibrio sp.]HWR03968.1 DNA polymerase IV [Humidesulfovibrio sp.]